MMEIDQSLRELTGYRLRRSTSAALSKMKSVFAKFGLRRTTYSTLALIVEYPGLRQSQLAETLGIERPNFVQIVDELEKTGLVFRKPAEDDRRAYAMQPTPDGIVLFNKARTAVQQVDEKLTSGLSPEQLLALQSALKTVEENANRLEIDDEI